jgi:murein DD-endopeptidase MepM/ murein hydrolase activator NlpD
MGKWSKFVSYWREGVRYSTSNPANFDDNWSFISTRIRLVSFIIVFLLLYGIGFTWFVMFGPLQSVFSAENQNIEREELTAQMIVINELKAKITQQESFIVNLQNVMLGKLSPDLAVKVNDSLQAVDVKKFNTTSSADEESLAEKVKSDYKNPNASPSENSSLKIHTPIKGTLSEEFHPNRHPGVDIVAKKDASVLACMTGVVVYSGYSKEDGNFIILLHSNGYMSVYKHNKVNLKKTGQKVRTGDPIAIVGSSGENTSGPHLHFELWHEQKPINPTSFLSFN